MCNKLFFALMAATLLFPHFAWAAAIDGTSPVLCAITEVVDCSAQGECLDIAPEEVNIPTFIKIDFKKKSLGGLNDSDSKTTPIKNLEQLDGYIVLQGAENHRAWSMMVTSETGKMSASVSGEDYGFLLFGACTVLP